MFYGNLRMPQYSSSGTKLFCMLVALTTFFMGITNYLTFFHPFSLLIEFYILSVKYADKEL